MSQESNKYNWQPTAELSGLKARAVFYKQIRQFFAKYDVLEVETPLLCARAVTDPYIQAFAADGKYLQTSPEYAMKRLLAAGSGAIYQICKAFRQEESGNFHNSEFTMLEWYRPGFDHHRLIAEVDEIIQMLLGTQPARKISYYKLFMETLGINPHTASIEILQNCAEQHGISLTATAKSGLTVTDWLQLLMSHIIEPQMVGNFAWAVYDFPVAQAALARIIHTDEGTVASRFEFYMQGIELANGYHELQNPAEQAKRFTEDNAKRVTQGIKFMEPDERLLAALEAGLPDCAGVTLGLDRLLMLKLQADSIAKVLSFTFENA